jgi:predicted nucleic acid-binding protein
MHENSEGDTMQTDKLHAVIDTNVLFQGITTQAGAPGSIIQAWQRGAFVPLATNALCYEYESVLQRKLSPERWLVVSTILDDLFDQVRFVPIEYTWRPVSTDPGDDHLIDCAISGKGMIVTWNQKDLRIARDLFGVPVLTPDMFLLRLIEHHERQSRRGKNDQP